MANVIYPKYKENLLSGSSNVSLNENTVTDGVYLALLDASYTYNAAHVFYSDAEASEVTTPVRITNPTVVNGVLDGDDITFPSVPVSTITKAVVFRKNSGASSTWRLVAYFDSGLGNVPYTANGSNIPVKFNVSGIIKL